MNSVLLGPNFDFSLYQLFSSLRLLTRLHISLALIEKLILHISLTKFETTHLHMF